LEAALLIQLSPTQIRVRSILLRGPRRLTRQSGASHVPGLLVRQTWLLAIPGPTGSHQVIITLDIAERSLALSLVS